MKKRISTVNVDLGDEGGLATFRRSAGGRKGMIPRMLTPAIAAVFVGVVLASSACGDDDDDAPKGGSDEELLSEFCEHLTEGPTETVASSTTAATAPDVTYHHTRVSVSLGDETRFVRYEVDAAGDVAFAFSHNEAVVYQQAGANVTPTEIKTGSFPCSDLARVDVVPLAVGSVVLAIAPSSNASTYLVVEEPGAEEAAD
ncbi:MAG: hypothetical protein H6729_16690 [Deltaproteobacteria bacterium]|nr:hypothetical protein [Deltaproteobacteria bacterium]